MASDLKVISYNLHGFNQGEPLLREFCNNVAADVLFVQEHWLSSVNMHKLLSFSDNYYCLCSSAMEHAIQTGVMRGRPFGGVAILFHKRLSHAVRIIALTERYIIARVANICFVNIYAPTVDKRYDQYTELHRILSEISDELENNSSRDDIIVFGGDCNNNLFKDSGLSRLFQQFFTDHNLLLPAVGSTGGGHTFENSVGQFSFIDYFAISANAINVSDVFEILDNQPNLSDHLPIKITLRNQNIIDVLLQLCVKQPPSSKTADKPTVTVKQLRWDHADLWQYYCLTHNNLYPVFERLNSFYNTHGVLRGDGACSIDPTVRDEALSVIEETYEAIVVVLQGAAASAFHVYPRISLNSGGTRNSKLLKINQLRLTESGSSMVVLNMVTFLTPINQQNTAISPSSNKASKATVEVFLIRCMRLYCKKISQLFGMFGKVNFHLKNKTFLTQ